MNTARIPMIFSALTLVISLTGAGAYAASQVNGTTIMNHSIGIGKLTPKAVKQLKGQHGERGLEGFDGRDGSDGAQGVPGGVGATGTAGGFDMNKLTYITGTTGYIAAGSSASVSAECPAGSKVVGGGFTTSNLNQVGTSGPFTFPDGMLGWGADVWNDDTTTIAANAYAVCALP